MPSLEMSLSDGMIGFQRSVEDWSKRRSPVPNEEAVISS
jgi:hypothetical protein